MMVGTDLVHALLLSSVATIGHSWSGRVDVVLAASVLVGAIPGVLVGAKTATSIPERSLRAGLAAILIAIGIQFSAFDTAVVVGGPDPSFVEAAWPEDR
jgi:hypothetical protein